MGILVVVVVANGKKRDLLDECFLLSRDPIARRSFLSLSSVVVRHVYTSRHPIAHDSANASTLTLAIISIIIISTRGK
jgi:hypothetical protein